MRGRILRGKDEKVGNEIGTNKEEEENKIEVRKVVHGFFSLFFLVKETST